MKVKELIANLSMLDQEAEIVCVSGMGWPTFNPIEYTTQVHMKRTHKTFPFWFEKTEKTETSLTGTVLY